MISHPCLLSSHDALTLLRHSLVIPKILYILRTAPCFSSPCLAVYDTELRSTLSDILNIDLSCESAWSQATLPVCFGGIGVHRASQLAPSWPKLLVPMTSSTKFCLFGSLAFHTQLLMPLLFSGAGITTTHLLSLYIPDKRHGTYLQNYTF